MRGDDGAGEYVYQKIVPKGRLKIINAGMSPESVMDEVIEIAPCRVVFIDAADFGGRPGEIRVIDKENIPQTTLTTHNFPLSVIASIIEEETRAEVFFLGIQAKTVELKEEISEEVKAALDKLIEFINNLY